MLILEIKKKTKFDKIQKIKKHTKMEVKLSFREGLCNKTIESNLIASLNREWTLKAKYNGKITDHCLLELKFLKADAFSDLSLLSLELLSSLPAAALLTNV